MYSDTVEVESRPLRGNSRRSNTNLTILQQLRLICVDSYYTLPFLSAMLMHISQQLSGTLRNRFYLQIGTYIFMVNN